MPSPLHPAPGFAPDFVADRLDEALALPGRVPVYGLAGLQGSGKSTLVAQMAALGASRGLAVAMLSIDDFYLRREQRQALGLRVHPLLAMRGPPGTHDLPLALDTLDALRRGEPVALPRFDKRSDDRLPPSVPLAAAQLVLFEGWFLKTPPQAAAELADPINPLESAEDPDGRWRHYCNDALGGYTDLWQRLDWLTWLQPPGFEVVPDWRWEQEHAANGGMDRPQVERFVQVFERTSRQALRTLPAIADRTIQLDAQRRPIS